MYAERQADREARLREEKIKADAEIQKHYSAQKEANDKEIENAKNESKILAEKKKNELIEIRNQQAKEIAEIEARFEEAVKEKIADRAVEGKLEVEKRKQELERKQRDLEVQTNIRSEHLNDNSKILKNGEMLRQECLNRLRDDRKAEIETQNAKTLEMNQKLHEIKILREERLQQLDEQRNEEQKKHLLKKENVILNGINNSTAISSSLALEDNFELFKQQCKGLRDSHRRFCMEYDNIEAQLLKAHRRLEEGKKMGDCEMDDLLSALRVFNERATGFSAAGSTAEDAFQTKIGQVIELLRKLRVNFNEIQSEIDDYEGGETEKKSGGIGKQLTEVSTLMENMGVLIQQFNVIGNDHLQRTLAIQMEQAQSSSHHHAIQNGPPAYDASPKGKTAAITEN